MEEFQLNIFGIIFLFGALQGLILALIFLFSNTYSRKSNLFLGILLLSFMMLNLLGAYEESDLMEQYPVFRFFPIVWYSVIPPATYFFVQYLTNPDYKIKRWGVLLFIPLVFDIVFQCFELYSYLSGNINIPEDFSQHYFYQNIFEFIAGAFALTIMVLILRTLSDYEKSLYNYYAEISDKSLKWLSHTLIGGLVLVLVWITSTIVDFYAHSFGDAIGQILLIGLSILIYWIGYSMLMRRELFTNDKIEGISELSNDTPKLSEKTEDHYQTLLKLMSEKRPYRNPNINMSLLSEEIGLSKSYLSQIINSKESKNFFDFVNSYRVNEVQENMKNPKFNHYSILGLALEAGFKSKSTFNAVFKKMTGMTPSEFKKLQNPE